MWGGGKSHGINVLAIGAWDLKDYKFFCFNGSVKFLKVDFNRFERHQANYYDTAFNLLPFGEKVCPPDPSHIERPPKNFDKMLSVAGKLSEGFPFMRVDLYNINGTIYFGEMTFSPNSGFGKFDPDSYDKEIGELLMLPKG